MALKPITHQTPSGNPTFDVRFPSWIGMQNGDVGAKTKIADFAQAKMAQILGTIGAGFSLTLRGSCKPNPDETVATDWFTLKDPANAAATFAALGGVQLNGNPLFISPQITAGDGTTLIDVYLLAKM